MAPSALSLRDGKRAPRFLKAPRRIMFTVHIFAEMHKERAIFRRFSAVFLMKEKTGGAGGPKPLKGEPGNGNKPYKIQQNSEKSRKFFP